MRSNNERRKDVKGHEELRELGVQRIWRHWHFMFVCLLVKASASALAVLPEVRPTHTQTSWFYWFTSTCNLQCHWSSNAQLMWVILLCRVETTMSQKWIPKTASWVVTMLFHAGCINENHPLKNITLTLRKLKNACHTIHTHLGWSSVSTFFFFFFFFLKAFCG